MIQTLVQHHPSRAHLLPALLERLPSGAVVVTDPEPDGIPNPWRCYRACLQAIQDEATHVLIVQDDALPHPDFPLVVTRCVEARPDRIVCFFVTSHAVQGARRMLQSQSPWVEMLPTEYLPVVATSWPVEQARAFYAWTEKMIVPTKRSDDGIAGRWIRHHSVRPIATVPCLVQHPDMEPSLIGKRAMAGKNPIRVAIIDPADRDILSIDWS